MSSWHYQDGALHGEAVPLTSIAETYGTPTFVYSRAAITGAYRAFEAAFAGREHRICYAVKANSNLGVLSLLASLGAHFDIVSDGELERVIRAGGDPARVVFSGVGKQKSEMTRALELGINCFNVESSAELLSLETIAQQLGKQAPISIRVNPDVDAGTHPYISTGLKDNKFGVQASEALELYAHAQASTHLEIKGIDCHIGSQITDLSPFQDAFQKVLMLVDELSQLGINLAHIDLGGGIGVRYRDEDPIDIGDFGAAVQQQMGNRQQTLLFEPGRYIVANAGVLLCRVINLKPQEARNFAIVDGAMNDLLRPSLYNAWQEILEVQEPAEAAARVWDVVGPVCETGDFLGKDRSLALTPDSLLAVMSAGAYGFVMSSNYNSRGRAAEVMIDGATTQLVRARETIDDQLRLEHPLKT